MLVHTEGVVDSHQDVVHLLWPGPTGLGMQIGRRLRLVGPALPHHGERVRATGELQGSTLRVSSYEKLDDIESAWTEPARVGVTFDEACAVEEPPSTGLLSAGVTQCQDGGYRFLVEYFQETSETRAWSTRQDSAAIQVHYFVEYVEPQAP